MIEIRMLDEEAEDLRDILEAYLSDLRMEISNTESMDWRVALKEREAFLKRLIPQLQSQPVHAAAGPVFEDG